MTLGEKLQRLRRARGLTQEQLAEKVGVSRQSLSGWENDTSLPDTANVIALADLFGVTTDYLLREGAPGGHEQGAAMLPEKSEAAQKPSWRMAPRKLGAGLLVAAALIGLVALRVMASFHPANVGIDGRQYTGFAAFLYYYDLWWAVRLLVIVLALGLLQWFGPWLWQQGVRIWHWLRRKGM